MFELQADQRQEFEELASSGAIDSLTIIELPLREYQPPGDDSEQPDRPSDH